jgi:hypothetical protein
MAKFETSPYSLDWRTYHLRIPIAPAPFWDAGSGFGSPHVEANSNPTAKALSAVKGIESFYVHDGFELVVHKAGSYAWGELDNQLKAVIATHEGTAEWPIYKETEPLPSCFSEEDAY